MTPDDLKKTPLTSWHHAHGGKMVDFGGWDMPVQYETGIIKEHLTTRKAAGLFDVSHMGRFRIKGKDRIAFLQHVLSNNCESLEPWQAQYTQVPNATGGLIDDAYLYRFGEDDYLLVVNASNTETCRAHFEKQASAFSDLTLEDNTATMAMIALQGPVSKQVLEKLIESGDLPKPFRNRLGEVTLCGASVLATRTGYTGEPLGFELFVPADKAEEIWCAIIEAGKDLGVKPVGLGARDTLRLEAGMPLYGHEFGMDPDGKEIPAFAFPLTRIAVSFSERKGEFIGRKALEAQFKAAQAVIAGTYKPTEALPRRILPLAVLDRGMIRAGDKVFLGEKKVGVVTSGTAAPYWTFEGEGATMHITDESHTRSIAMAYIDATLNPEQELEVVVRTRRIKTQLVRFHGRANDPPFFRALPVS